MNDKKYNFLMAIAKRLPSDGEPLKYKDMTDIMTESQWKSCYKWLATEAVELVDCEMNHVCAKSTRSAKNLTEQLKRIKTEQEKSIRHTIREVVAMLDVPASTLRFWEDTFPQLDPERTPSGQRRYSKENIEICKLIKHLLRDKGYSLEYARRELEAYCKCMPRNNFACKSVDEALNLLCEVSTMVNGNIHVEARIKAVEKWINSIEVVEKKPRSPHKNI